jgi:NADPH-dependent ferric siderophore reductase
MPLSKPDSEFLPSDDVELAALSARVEELSRRKEAKAKAEVALSNLKSRHKQKKAASHPCGDVLSYRYSEHPEYDLGKLVISIVGFAHLARLLAKTDVERLAGNEALFHEAKSILEKETDFPSSWYDMYKYWRKSNPILALKFFDGRKSNPPRFFTCVTEF